MLNEWTEILQNRAGRMNSVFLVMREKFREFYDHVKKGHQENSDKNRGHDLAHDVTVAQIGYELAANQRVADMAWVAALLHSMDYWRRGDQQAFMLNIEEALVHIPEGCFTEAETREIAEAAFRHGEKNQPDETAVSTTLKDADRLAILMVTVLFRIGQGYPKLPAVQFEYLSKKNPASTYAEPMSCLDDLRNCLSEFVPQFRLEKAKALAEGHVATLERVIGMIELEHEGLGLKNLVL